MNQALACSAVLLFGALPAFGLGGGFTAHPAGDRSRQQNPNLPPETPTGNGMALMVYTVHFGGGGAGTGTGYWEDFTVYAPDQSKPRPLLVAFHKYGVSQFDIQKNTTFFQEAMERGWHVLAPLSASGVHMGSIEGQINTEKTIEWVLENFNINRERIYGVGFSMGGGAVTNFAARHLDPTQYMFAAVVDHTGGIDHVDTYEQSPSTQFVFDFWFGNGTPNSWDPFLMARSCLLDFEIHPTMVDPTTNLARNLVHVPTKVTRASIEPEATAYLAPQCDVFVNHLTTLGGQVKYEIVPYFGHSWAMLDEFKTLNWLSKRRLTLPTSHNTLADQDGRYFHFTVTQDAPLAFTPFTWGVDTVNNALTLSGTENLAALEVDLASAGLSGTQTFTLDLSTTDGLADEVSLRGWPAAPTAVFRDGIEIFTSWIYDGTEQLLTLQEPDGTQAHEWVVTP